MSSPLQHGTWWQQETRTGFQLHLVSKLIRVNRPRLYYSLKPCRFVYKLMFTMPPTALWRLLYLRFLANIRRCHFTVHRFPGAGKGSALVPVEGADLQLLQWRLLFFLRRYRVSKLLRVNFFLSFSISASPKPLVHHPTHNKSFQTSPQHKNAGMSTQSHLCAHVRISSVESS